MTEQENFWLRRDPIEAARARQRVAEFCTAMTADTRCTAQLLTSELVTNAIEHGTGAISLRLTATGTILRVEVADESLNAAAVQEADSERLSGRGLLLVERLSAAWGISPVSGGVGKIVWFTLDDGRLT